MTLGKRNFSIERSNPHIISLTDAENPAHRAVLEPHQVPEAEFEVPPHQAREMIQTFELSEEAMKDPLFLHDQLPLLTPHGFSSSFQTQVKFGLDDPKHYNLLPAADLDEGILAEAIVSYAVAHKWDLDALCIDFYRLSEFLDLNEEILSHLTGKVPEDEREDLLERVVDFLGLQEPTADILRYMSGRKSNMRFTTIFPVLQHHLRPLTRLDVAQILSAEPLLPDQKIRLEDNLLHLLSFGTPGNNLAVDYRVLNDITTGFQILINMDSGMNFRPDEHMGVFKQRCIEDRIQLFREDLDLGPLSRVKTMYDVPVTREEWEAGGRGLPDWPMVYDIEEKWFNPKIGPQ